MSVHPISFTALAVALAQLAAPAAAKDAATESTEAPGDLTGAGGVIIVTGIRDKYGIDVTRTATRTETELKDLPQSISVITERQIEDQAARSIADILRNVPGATIGQGEGHRDQLTLRGNNSTADFFIDGLRDDIQYYRPLYNLQRVEVLRGSNAMVFGRGGGGGIVNRVTKVPLFEQFGGASAGVNSFGAWHLDADLNQPLAENVAARVNAVYENFDTFRDVYEGRLVAANPSLRALLGPDTGIIVAYEYIDDERVVDRGIPSLAGRPLRGFQDTFFGLPGVNELGFEAHFVRASLEHRFTPELTLNSRLLYADYDKFYRNAFPATAVTAGPGGAPQVGIEAYFDAFQRENLFSQNDLVWTVATGPAAHTILAGFEYGRQDTGNQRLNGFFGDGARRTFVPLADPIAIPPIDFRPGPGQRGTVSEADIIALYLQDQIEFGRFELIAGLRYDRFDLSVDDLVAGRSFARVDDLWSPRAGLVYHPVEQVSLYASYGRSFLPQSGEQFNSLDVTASTLKPERFQNYEVGAKWEPREGFLLSVAAYQLDRTNTRAAGPSPGTIVQTGRQRSRGIELEAVGELRPGWQLAASYALQEAEIRSTTSAAPAGRDVQQVPENQASLWTRYDFNPSVGIGLGVYHQGDSFASISNKVVLPSFTRVDAAMFFRIAPRVEAQVNIENLLDETYFPTAHNDNNIAPGAPINARATVRLQF